MNRKATVLQSWVISRRGGGEGGGDYLVEVSIYFGGAQPAHYYCIYLSFEGTLTLLPKCFVLL